MAALRGADPDYVNATDALRLHDSDPNTFPLSPEDVEAVLDLIEQAASLIDSQAKEIAALREALNQIDAWSRAYPLSVFPEPDFVKARELLEAGGMTLDAISASNMRHIVEGVGQIARAALDTPTEPTPSTDS